MAAAVVAISSTPQFSRDVSGFLDTLPQTTLSRLYDSPSSCLAIFRLLPEAGRYLVLNMLWLKTPISGEDLVGTLARRSEGRRRLEGALEAVERLRIVAADPPDVPPRQQTFTLDGTFRSQMRRALVGGGSSPWFGIPIGGGTISIAELDQQATTKWESILHYMVGSRHHLESPSATVLALLRRSGLMVSAGPRALKITARGFQFLLENLNTQLWELLLRYLSLSDERNADVVEILAFLFMLGSLQLGQRYAKSTLTPAQAEMLEDLRHIGLVYEEDHGAEMFYPTRLATTLTSAMPTLSAMQGSNDVTDAGFIILETNYRVYAYTNNELQLAVLNLFVSLKSRFPNLAIGTITRESVKAALANGIGAEQIISYLHAHAHPQMRRQAAAKDTALLPVTVLDQIRIWENDKNRVNATEGFLYEDFKSQADFELVRNYAQTLGVTLWEEAKSRRFVVSSEGHESIKAFITRRMNKFQ